MASYASYCQVQGIDCARRARLARSLEVATYWRCLGFRWLRLAEQAQDRGCLGPREPRGFQLRLRTRNNTRQGQRGRAKSIRLILTNDPVEAPFRLRIASEGHMHEAIRSGWRSTPAQC